MREIYSSLRESVRRKSNAFDVQVNHLHVSRISPMCIINGVGLEKKTQVRR